MSAVTHNLPQLMDALRIYAQITRKSAGDIAAHEAREFSFELYQAFKQRAPSPMRIYRAAVARRFAMGRRTNAMTSAIDGISQASWLRAVNLLGGKKSDYFSVQVSEGSPRIRRVRFSQRTARDGAHVFRRLKGGRYGNRFAWGSLSPSQVDEDALANERERDPSIKRLNLRALATAVELGRRAAAAKGSTMAVQWLPRVYKTRRSSTVKRGPLIVTSKSGFEMGRVDFHYDGNEPVGVTLTGKVPGTEAQMQRHGILHHVEQARVADRFKYINRKLAEQKQKAGMQ